MREILFRGKTVNNGKWVYGFLSKSRNTEEKPALLKRCIDCEEKGIMISHIVDHETVGQFTGLTDKNGTKVFEGDILQTDECEFVVKFGECGGVKNVEHNVGYIGFYVEPIGKYAAMLLKSGLRTDILYWINSCDCEVIGNIHDNPDISKNSENL